MRNHKTGRCIRECAEDEQINIRTGRCMKPRVVKDCPDGKMRNPKTGRCIKIKVEITPNRSQQLLSAPKSQVVTITVPQSQQVV
jgi:hypothetical protein